MATPHAEDDEVSLTASARRTAGSRSARSFLLTALGEFVHPRGTPVWTATLVAALATLGIEEKAARQAIARLATEGLVAAEKSGRRVCWHITQPGSRLLADGARRIYSFLADTSAWDGNWLVVSVPIPETHRQLRHKLRTRLTWLGMGSPSPGIWVVPDTSRGAEAEAAIEELGIAERAVGWTGKLAIGDPAALIADTWSLDSVEQRYELFLSRFGDLRVTTPLEAFQAQVRLVQEWRRFPFIDPALPRELLDHNWPGPQAAQLFRRQHDEWHLAAQSYWSDLQSRTSS